MRKIVLASKSPRRRELLENIGLKFDIVVCDTDEDIISKDIDPSLYVRELSFIKASSAVKLCAKNTFVIGADTVVVHEGQILGKPKDRDDAFCMLRSMSGKTHRVYTGISIIDTNDMHAVSEYAMTEVTFRQISDKEINHYIDNFSVMDKAGAYGIQEYAGTFAESINGDYFNIVGLPVCKLITMISKEYGEDLI